MEGTIKRVFPEKGFGFIRGKDGISYFFHRSTCDEGVRLPSLAEGDPVQFEPGPDEGRGPRAERVWQ